MTLAMLADPRAESMALALGDCDDAVAALAGFYAHLRAAGLRDAADAIPAILSRLRGMRREVEAAGEGGGRRGAARPRRTGIWRIERPASHPTGGRMPVLT